MFMPTCRILAMESIKTSVSHDSMFEIRANFSPFPHTGFIIYFPIFRSQKVTKLPYGSKGNAG